LLRHPPLATDAWAAGTAAPDGVSYGVYAILRGGRNQEGGGLGPIPERTIHAVAGIRMLIGGAVAIGGHLPRGRGDTSLPLRLNPAQVLESG
jgi:hypothetical protein